MRKSGKTSLLRESYGSGAIWIDLLLSEEFARYGSQPQCLRERVSQPGALVVIDEVQKVPALLDEVHWLIENRRAVFALSGSSARKLRRGHANMLGGRALRHELHGLVYPEISEGFSLNRILNHG